MDPHNAGLLLLIIGIALAVLFAVLAASTFDGGKRRPTLRPRSLPSLPGMAVDTQQASEPMIVLVAGRSYQVTDGDGKMGGETCPWCLGSLDDAGPGEVVRCDRPYCRQPAHRRHNLEGGGCGGMCSIAGG
jgi:hypothetical protein